MAQQRIQRSQTLLCEIVRCSELAGAVADETHPCSQVVRFQDRFAIEFQPPTPWVGRLAEAPILFIGSNPNISGREHYPDADASDEELIDFFDQAFEGDRPQIKQGTRPLMADRTHGGSVRTWAGVRGRAEELLDRQAVPGRDYAMTEIVHCRSWNEIGVAQARDRCADRFLERTVGMSNARVVVALGAHVREWLRNRWSLSPAPVSAVDIGGRERLVAFLPHPTSFGPKRFGSVMPGELPRLRAVIRDASQ